MFEQPDSIKAEPGSTSRFYSRGQPISLPFPPPHSPLSTTGPRMANQLQAWAQPDGSDRTDTASGPEGACGLSPPTDATTQEDYPLRTAARGPRLPQEHDLNVTDAAGSGRNGRLHQLSQGQPENGLPSRPGPWSAQIARFELGMR